MRKKFFVLLCIFAITLTGCHMADPPQRNSGSITDVSSAEDVMDTKPEPSEPETSSGSKESTIPGESEIPSVPPAESKPLETTPPVQNMEPATSQNTPPSQLEEKPPAVSDQPKPTDPQLPASAESAPPEKPVQSKEPNATATDSQAVADKVLIYINQYRAEQGCSPAVKLPGLTRYAEYRSGQLVSNFAHNTEDERTAATALQYGQYVDPPLYGMTGDPYYTVNAREAIGMGGYAGTVDEVAKSLARLIKNSPSHWAYVGSAEYGYLGVGVTYRSGIWYCDIAMAQENTDEK